MADLKLKNAWFEMKHKDGYTHTITFHGYNTNGKKQEVVVEINDWDLPSLISKSAKLGREQLKRAQDLNDSIKNAINP